MHTCAAISGYVQAGLVFICILYHSSPKFPESKFLEPRRKRPRNPRTPSLQELSFYKRGSWEPRFPSSRKISSQNKVLGTRRERPTQNLPHKSLQPRGSRHPGSRKGTHAEATPENTGNHVPEPRFPELRFQSWFPEPRTERPGRRIRKPNVLRPLSYPRSCWGTKTKVLDTRQPRITVQTNKQNRGVYRYIISTIICG